MRGIGRDLDRLRNPPAEAPNDGLRRIECAVCGGQFFLPKQRGGNAKYCSGDCRDEGARRASRDWHRQRARENAKAFKRLAEKHAPAEG